MGVLRHAGTRLGVRHRRPRRRDRRPAAPPAVGTRDGGGMWAAPDPRCDDPLRRVDGDSRGGRPRPRDRHG
jgi:hypothetical protein